MLEQHLMRQFLLLVFALLVPAFMLWTVVAPLIAIPAIGFVNIVMPVWYPDIVNSVLVDNYHAVLMTEFGEHNGQPVPAAQSEYRLGFELDTRILSYSLPFYTALHFATPKSDYLGTYIAGLLVLYPLIVIGVVALCLRELMFALGPLFLEQPDASVPNAEIIGLVYQFSVLIVPTLAPCCIWLWQSRDSALLAGVKARLEKAAAKASG